MKSLSLLPSSLNLLGEKSEPQSQTPIQCTKTVMHGVIPYDLSKWSVHHYAHSLLSESDLGNGENHAQRVILDVTV